MTEDVRRLLQEAEGPSDNLDEIIHSLVLDSVVGFWHSWSPTRDYTTSIDFMEGRGCDWIIANVNGQVGGTPFACVGVSEDQASYAATPLLSLWLSYFRFQLGDEREEFRDREKL